MVPLSLTLSHCLEKCVCAFCYPVCKQRWRRASWIACALRAAPSAIRSSLSQYLSVLCVDIFLFFSLTFFLRFLKLSLFSSHPLSLFTPLSCAFIYFTLAHLSSLCVSKRVIVSPSLSSSKQGKSQRLPLVPHPSSLSFKVVIDNTVEDR